MNPPIDPLLFELDYLESRGELDDLYGASVRLAIMAGVALPSDHQAVHGRYQKVARAAQLGSVIPFRRPRLPEQGVCLGRDPRGQWVFQDLLSRAMHFAVVGSTGAGKTSVWVFLLMQLFAAGIGFLGIELYKRDLRHMLPAAARVGRSLAVLSHRDLRWNPLEPDGLDPQLHLEAACASLSRCLGLPERASMLLRRAAHDAYYEAGVFGGVLDRCPTVFHVYERVRAMEANAAAKEALLDRLGSLLLALGPEVLAYHRAWTPSGLLDKLVVLELAGDSETIKQWVTTSLLFGLFHGQVARGAMNAPLRHMTVLDDAQRFLGGDGLDQGGMTPIAELLGVVRSAGLAVAANFQSLAPVPPATLANMTARIVGVLGSTGDVRRVTAELNLDAEQEAWIRHHLRPGRYLMQFSYGAWRHPFVVELPKPTLRPASEQLIADGRAELEALPVVEAAEFRHWRPGKQAAVGVTSPSKTATKAHATPGAAFGLTDRETRLLCAVVEHPLQPQSVYPKLAGMKPADCKLAREQLIELGLIKASRVTINARGRQPVVLEPTAAGKNEVRNHASGDSAAQ